MADSTFDRLVAQISDDERSELFDELSRSMAPQGETVLDEDRQDEYSDAHAGLEERYRRLGLFARLWLFIRSFFQSTTPLELYERDALSGLARRVDKAAPGLISVSGRLALPGLYNKVRELESAAHSGAILLRHISGNRKGEFLTVLLGMEYYESRTVFDFDMNPDRVAEAHPDFSDSDLKRHMENRLEEILQSIPSDVRTRMYVNARYIDNLRELSTFDFARFFALFHTSRGTEVESPPLRSVAGHIERLAALFEGLRVSPGELMTRALYSWLRLEDHSDGEEADESTDTTTYRVKNLSHSLGVIAEFGRTVPLLALTRLAHDSLLYAPDHVGGGEDWFASIKRFWHTHIDVTHREYVMRQRRRALLTRGSELCHAEVRMMHGYPGTEEDQPGLYAATLGFLKTFFDAVFMKDFHAPMRLLQVNGQFYKDANRGEFNDSFEVLRSIPDRLRRLQRDVSEEGTTGLVLQRIARDISDPAKRVSERRKALVIVHKSAAKIASDAIQALRSIAAVLNGILYGEVGGPYDTLSNLNSIDGRNSDQYRKTLDSVLVQCKTADEILTGLYDLESMQDSSS
ncbi:MAG: DUF5312 family protein [Spirochaetaceae bacterium]